MFMEINRFFIFYFKGLKMIRLMIRLYLIRIGRFPPTVYLIALTLRRNLWSSLDIHAVSLQIVMEGSWYT
jgi:hypothetical protein